MQKRGGWCPCAKALSDEHAARMELRVNLFGGSRPVADRRRTSIVRIIRLDRQQIDLELCAIYTPYRLRSIDGMVGN